MSAPTVHDFIRQLEVAGIHYRLASVRDAAIMVEVHIPGERWEVEFFDDRKPEVEVFRSDGTISGAERLLELFEKAAD